jgi:chromosome partitioning protein
VFESGGFGEMADEQEMSAETRIIAVAHQKGGTGKTTSVCALAASFASLEPALKVCVIDLDPQGASTLHLGGEGPFQTGSYDAVVTGKPLAEATYKTQIDNCVLVPATSRLILSEMDLASRSMSFDAMAKHLKDPAHGIDIILVDCPSGFGMISTMIMTVADLVVIPTPPLFFAIRALRETISYLNRLRRDASVFVAVVMTMFEADSSLHSVMVKKVRRDWGDLVVPFEIPREESVERAAIESKLLIDQFPGAESAKAYRKLAASFAVRLGFDVKAPHLDVPVPPQKNIDGEATPQDLEEQSEHLTVPEKRPVAVAEQRPVADTVQPAAQKCPVAENLTPVRENPTSPPTGGLPKVMKGLIGFVLFVVTAIVIYAAIQADMLAWVMLAYLILILAFFPVLVFLLV